MADPNIITWPDFYNLAKAIDLLAADYNVASFESYSPLLTNYNTPFPQPDTPQVTFSYHFYVETTPGVKKAPVIVDQWIKKEFKGRDNDVWDPDNGSTPNLKLLAQQGYLFFVYQPDGCWCRTIFKVLPNPNNSDAFRLYAVGDNTTVSPFVSGDPIFGGCQTLDLPEDALDYTQNIIPAGAALQYSDGLKDNFQQWLQFPKCVNDSSKDIAFEFEDNANASPMIGAERKMTGYLTWPITADWMTLLYGAIELILSSPNVILTQGFHSPSACALSTPDNPYIPPYGTAGCSPRLLPGALTDIELLNQQKGCIAKKYPPTGVYFDCYPWMPQLAGNTDCCNEDPCDSAPLNRYNVLPPRAYKNTLLQLQTLVMAIRTYTTTFNYSTPDRTSYPCCVIQLGTESVNIGPTNPSPPPVVTPHYTKTITLPTEEELKSRCPELATYLDGGSVMFILSFGFADSGPLSVKFMDYTCDCCHYASTTTVACREAAPGDDVTIEVDICPSNPSGDAITWVLTGRIVSVVAP